MTIINRIYECLDSQREATEARLAPVDELWRPFMEALEELARLKAIRLTWIRGDDILAAVEWYDEAGKHHFRHIAFGPAAIAVAVDGWRLGGDLPISVVLRSQDEALNWLAGFAASIIGSPDRLKRLELLARQR